MQIVFLGFYMAKQILELLMHSAKNWSNQDLINNVSKFLSFSQFSNFRFFFFYDCHFLKLEILYWKSKWIVMYSMMRYKYFCQSLGLKSRLFALKNKLFMTNSLCRLSYFCLNFDGRILNDENRRIFQNIKTKLFSFFSFLITFIISFSTLISFGK